MSNNSDLDVALLNEQLRKLTTGMDELRTELRSEITGLRTELRSDMADLRTELHSEVGSLRSDMADLRTELAAVKEGVRPLVNVDFSLIQRQQAQILAELATQRDDIGVLAAITQRLDGTISGLVNEIRATHAQQARFDRRLRNLESTET